MGGLISKMSTMGPCVAQLKGYWGTEIYFHEGGVKIVYQWDHCGCRCLGWNKEYELIPKQSLVNAFVMASSRCKCVPFCCLECCQYKEAWICLDILEKGDFKPVTSDEK